MSQKIEVRKSRYAQQWYTWCPVCTTHHGFFTSKSYRMTLRWAVEHVDNHRMSERYRNNRLNLLNVDRMHQ